jgi:hypothetical protein
MLLLVCGALLRCLRNSASFCSCSADIMSCAGQLTATGKQLQQCSCAVHPSHMTDLLAGCLTDMGVHASQEEPVHAAEWASDELLDPARERFCTRSWNGQLGCRTPDATAQASVTSQLRHTPVRTMLLTLLCPASPQLLVALFAVSFCLLVGVHAAQVASFCICCCYCCCSTVAGPCCLSCFGVGRLEPCRYDNLASLMRCVAAAWTTLSALSPHDLQLGPKPK